MSLTLIFVAIGLTTASIVTGVVISNKRFNNKINDVKSDTTSPVAQDRSLSGEIDRLEKLKANLITVRRNIDELDIPVPENLTGFDDAESSLNKLSKFFEKYSKITTGTEAFILSILPVSQTGEALCSFATVAPDLLSNAFSDSVSALKDGMAIPGIDDVSTCLSKFCEGMAHTSPQSIHAAIHHHNYMSALLKPVQNGLTEMTGLNDAAASMTESIHDMGDVLGNAAELSIDPMDMTDLDFSGHIPVMTIAISSFREYNLLIDKKTDAISSLKNIGLDAAGAGAGGLLGAKAGAIAGSLFGPIGTLVGGIIGGIGGAMGGRAITNEIKRIPLKNAIEEYQSNAVQMRNETRSKSRILLNSIRTFTCEKRNEFKNDKMLTEIPVVESQATVTGITLILYQAVSEHIVSMKENINKIKSSFWYSDKEHGSIIANYEKRITDIERQLPMAKNIENNPKLALESLLSLQIPDQKAAPKYKKTFLECAKELKEMNDKNNSSILVWSYMVNGLYKKTLNEIADFSNNQMASFNQFVDQWKQRMSALENQVNVEKGKLGL